MPGPLEGVRVLDVGQLASAPFAAMILGDQGADVIKVEPVGLGDVVRIASFSRGGLPAFFLNLNRGKRSIAVNMQSDAGREVMLDLASTADVVIENMRPGVTDRLGVGYRACRKRNARIIYCSINGFGSAGPWADRPVIDPVIQGVTGLAARQKSEAIPIPDLVRSIVADKCTSQAAAQAISAALFWRERSGEGQHVEVPMLDATLYFNWPDMMMDFTLIGDDVRPGLRPADAYQLTDCADAKLVYFITSDKQRFGLFRALGRPELCDDPRFATMMTTIEPENSAALGRILFDEFAKVKRDEILARLVNSEVPCGPVLEPEEVLENEQILANDLLHEWVHPAAGPLRQPRQPAHFSVTPVDFRPECALLGQHTDDILAELGRTPEQVAALRGAGDVA